MDRIADATGASAMAIQTKIDKFIFFFLFSFLFLLVLVVAYVKLK